LTTGPEDIGVSWTGVAMTFGTYKTPFEPERDYLIDINKLFIVHMRYQWKLIFNILLFSDASAAGNRRRDRRGEERAKFAGISLLTNPNEHHRSTGPKNR
jgi:hypothetical protein